MKRDEEVRKQFSKRVAEVLGVVDPNVDAEQLEQQLQAAITSAAKATLPEKLDDDSEWMTEEYTGMIEELAKLKGKDRSRMAKRVRRMRKRLRNRYFSIMATRINKAAEMREVEKEFRLASENSLLKASTSQYCSTEALHAHFSEHFKAKPTPAATSLDNPEYVDALPLVEEVIKAGEPSLEEVKCEIAKLKNGRCLGVDKISGEHLKYVDTPELAEHLHALFRRVWTHGECPSTWTESRLKPLYMNKGSIYCRSK